MTALLAALLTAPAAVPAAAQGVAKDAGVSAARSRLDEAHARVDALALSLDKTAESYEQANAHRIRLQDEVVESAGLVEQAEDAVVTAEVQLSDRIAAAYKHPSEDVALSQAFVGETSAGSALHQAAMYRRMVLSAGADVADAQRTTSFVAGDARQEQIVAAGAQASVDEWQKQADALRDALRNAEDYVATAQAGLTAAELEAERLAEEERRAEAARQAAASFVSQTGAAPATLPEVGTMVCPVGQPNGFIDSWGFPRSGGRTHEGVDMFAPYGTPLFAVADGYIYRVYNNPLGGLSINLIDTEGNMYFYTHMSEATAVSGQQVHAGDTIGAVGTSGNAAGTPPHLHWQFHPGNGSPVNPYPLAYALCR